MAVDKLVDSAQLDADLEDVADAIRAKTGGAASLAFPADFISEIASISGGSGGDIEHATGTYKATSSYTSAGNRKITDVDTVGFTPTMFLLVADDKSVADDTAQSMILAGYVGSEWGTGVDSYRFGAYNNTVGADPSWYGSATNWTTQTNNYLYFNGENIYFRTNTVRKLIAGVGYHWHAFKKKATT